ncbi:hypothetical protein DF185_02470 [Marinifilum breve]|uniref:Uncharacterized protein n=1 Tax=Marinifilum breve TaxID=2184082 RepID=A0A2V4A508_9BACT|nr:hypothetical protein DF185_02470 [Marinifilum breve]
MKGKRRKEKGERWKGERCSHPELVEGSLNLNSKQKTQETRSKEKGQRKKKKGERIRRRC